MAVGDAGDEEMQLRCSRAQTIRSTALLIVVRSNVEPMRAAEGQQRDARPHACPLYNHIYILCKRRRDLKQGQAVRCNRSSW